jgi:hypothetical protein
MRKLKLRPINEQVVVNHRRVQRYWTCNRKIGGRTRRESCSGSAQSTGDYANC